MLTMHLSQTHLSLYIFFGEGADICVWPGSHAFEPECLLKVPRGVACQWIPPGHTASMPIL